MTLQLPKPPAWMREASCAGHPSPELWWSDARHSEAFNICAGCPVRVACLDYALQGDEWGVWAGTTHDERRDLQGRARRRG